MEPVKETKEMSKCELLLMKMEELGEVTFSVGPPGEAEKIKGFVCILSTFSPVFREMFNENWKSQNKVVELPDIDPKVFRLFLKLILKDSLEIAHLKDSNLSMEETLHLLYISSKYDVEPIEHVCRISIMENLDIGNAVMAYETLQFLYEPELEDFAFHFIITNISKILEDESFVNLTRKSLVKILKCDEVDVEEISLFKSVHRWAEFQSSFVLTKSPDKSKPESTETENADGNRNVIRDFLGDILYMIRFPLISSKNFFRFVRPTGVLTAEETIQVFQCITFKDDLDFVNDTAFATERRSSVKGKCFGTKVVACSAIIPSQPTKLKRVTFRSVFNGPHEYTVRFRISVDDKDILPQSSISFSSVGEPFHFDLETPISLMPHKNYIFFRDVKRDSKEGFCMRGSFSGQSLVVSIR